MINDRKRIDDRTEPCGTPLLIGLEEELWQITTVAIGWSEMNIKIKIQRDISEDISVR